MKKLLALILTLLLVFSVGACGFSSTETSTTQGDMNTSKDSGLNGDEMPESMETAAKLESKDTAAKSNEITFEEMIVVDNDDCTIKITGIDPDNIWGYSLNAYFENKSSDKTYMFSVQDAAVNGVVSDPFFATEVSPNKKLNDDINFMDDTLEDNGIIEFSDIEITFKVYDSDDWMADPVALETVHVYPFGKENASTFVRESQSTDNVLFDDENVSVIILNYTEDPLWGYTINLYLVNKTDRTLMYSVDDASVNGYILDPFWAKEVQPAKVAFTSLSWSDTQLEENGITEVEEIEMLFRIYDSEDWFADSLLEEIVTLKP